MRAGAAAALFPASREATPRATVLFVVPQIPAAARKLPTNADLDLATSGDFYMATARVTAQSGDWPQTLACDCSDPPATVL